MLKKVSVVKWESTIGCEVGKERLRCLARIFTHYYVVVLAVTALSALKWKTIGCEVGF